MRLKDITDYFKELNISEDWKFENFYRGKLDNKPDNSLGFYDITTEQYTLPIGGSDNKRERDMYISLLIHWNRYYDKTEDIGDKVYNKLIEISNTKDFYIGDNKVNYLELISGNEDIGTDEKNVYERVIQFKVNYSLDN